MKLFKIGMPVFLILLSIAGLIGGFNLPKANLGNPNGPLYFPVAISAFLLIFSIIYLFQEIKNLEEVNKGVTELFTGRTPLLIVLTIVFAVVYALIFDVLGFLISTILFLGALLFLVNGRKKWLVNVSVTLVFSFLSWYAFNELLGVSLP